MLMRMSLYLSLFCTQKQPDKLCVCICICNKNFETAWGQPYNKLDTALRHLWDDFEPILSQF